MTRLLFPMADADAARLDGTPLIALLDVDGTLAPITEHPADAAVPHDTRRALSALVSRPGVHVALVSGRSAAQARRMTAVPGVWTIGNHGYEVVDEAGEERVQPDLEPARGAVARAARRIEVLVAPVPGVVFEDKGWTLTVHYRMADPAVVPRLVATVRAVAEPMGLRVTQGKMVLEVRPSARVDKGTAVLRLAAQLGGLGNAASVLFMGDDVTDEDAFRALRSRIPRAVTVRVTHDETGAPTAAEFALRDPAEVREFLDWLARRRG